MAMVFDICMMAALAVVFAHNLALGRQVRILVAALKEAGPAFAQFEKSVDLAQQTVARASVVTRKEAPSPPAAGRTEEEDLVGRFYDIAHGGTR